MFDFIKSFNLSEEIKDNEIYYLFKTDSSEINLQIISSLQKFTTNQELFNYYTKQNCKSVIDSFKNISSISSKICKEEEKKEFESEIDKYISGLSKIIFLFSLIQKTNELLSDLLMNSKQYINRFFIDCQIQKNMQEKINSCINDLTINSLVISKRNYSRRSTKEGTICSLTKLSVNNPSKFKQQDTYSFSNDEELFFSQIHTPKFEEENEIIEEFEDPKSYSNSSGKTNITFKNIKEAISKTNSNKRCDSTLTLSKMHFIMQSELEPLPQVHKRKSLIIENDNNFNNFNTKKNKKNEEKEELSSISLKKNRQILTNFFDCINCLYKKGKINSEIKLKMKKLIISNSKNIIDKFLNKYEVNDYTFDKLLINEKIQTFILEYFKDLQ